jgi:hypothetical protein
MKCQLTGGDNALQFKEDHLYSEEDEDMIALNVRFFGVSKDNKKILNVYLIPFYSTNWNGQINVVILIERK